MSRVAGRRPLPLDLPAAPAPAPRPRGGAAPYRRGADAERQLLRALQGAGWPLAVRSAGSAGPFDLVLPAPGGGRLLQCKAVAAEPPPSLVRRWLAALPPVPAGWTAELWVRVAGAWRAVA